MTMETTLGTCIFCERPLAEDSLAVPGMSVCKDCVQGHPQPGNTMGIVPPASVLGRRLLILLPGLVIGFVVGCVASVLAFVFLDYLITTMASSNLTAMQVPAALLIGLLVFVFLTLLWELIFFSRLQHAGVGEWKSHLIKTLHLEKIIQRIQATPHLAVCCWQRPYWTAFTLPMQIGILLETTQGFIFCSAQGTRAVIPFTGIATAGTERLKIFPPRTAVRFDLNPTDGLPTLKGQVEPRQVFFAFMDEKSFQANSEKARAKQQLVLQKLESRMLEAKV